MQAKELESMSMFIDEEGKVEIFNQIEQMRRPS